MIPLNWSFAQYFNPIRLMVSHWFHPVRSIDSICRQTDDSIQSVPWSNSSNQSYDWFYPINPFDSANSIDFISIDSHQLIPSMRTHWRMLPIFLSSESIASNQSSNLSILQFNRWLNSFIRLSTHWFQSNGAPHIFLRDEYSSSSASGANNL